MSDPVERILTALREHGHEPRKAGAEWSCRCPAHDDNSPSLNIRTSGDGHALVHCFAGCEKKTIVEAVGLRLADLFAPDPNRRTGRNGHAPKPRRRGDGDETLRDAKGGRGSVTVASVATGGRTFPTARDAVAELERRYGPRSAEWIYRNAGGVPVGLVLRWTTPTGKKVRPVSRTADGSGWCIGGMPTPRPLYGLPDLLATPAGSRVFVTEGEKAADAARAVGLMATTSPHGCESAGKADWSPVAGREVVILPDHDDAGEGYADDVARLATAAGAKSVRVVRLVDLWPEMPEGGDMADLLEHRGGDADPIRAEVEALANKADAATPEPDAPDGDTVSAYSPFPVGELPEPIRGFVTQAARAIGCDASYVALPLLSGLASAIGNTHRIALKRGWVEPAILWTAIVGESGTAKSPAMELALRPVRNRQHDAMKEHAEAMREHADALAMHERDATQWKRSKVDTPPPPTPDAPIADRCWTDDATIEAMETLLQQNPRGLLMVRDELAGWFNFDRYSGGKGGGEVAKWLEMFGGRPMVVDRQTKGTLYIPQASVSIAGGIQPQTLSRALGVANTENGLASRLLMACPPKRCPGWTDDEVDANTEAAVGLVFDRLYALTPEADHDGEERPQLLTLTEDGKTGIVAWVNWHAEQMVRLDGPEGYAWAKLKGYAARLALVVHLIRWAASDATLRDPARVDGASIAAGVALARWFGDEARRVYTMLGESDERRESRRLVEWIASKGGTVSVRDLTRGPRQYRDTERATKALGELVADGAAVWVHNDHGPKGGRPTLRVRLVSRVGDAGDGDETPGGNGDGGGSVTVATPTDAGDGWGEL